MPRLSKRFTVVAPDLRGVGLTERTPDGYDKKTIAADIAALIEHLGGAKVHLAGHDMGGKAAYVLAHTRPELLSKSSLVDRLLPGTENMDPAKKGGAWHYGFHMASEFPEMLHGRPRAGVYRGADQDVVASQGRDQRRDDRRICAPLCDTRRDDGWLQLLPGSPHRHPLCGDPGTGKIAVPVLTIAGRYGVGEKLHAAISKEADDVQGVIAENTGHFVAEEDPEFFCEHVERFCAA